MLSAAYAQQIFQGFADDAVPASATAISAVTNTNFTRRSSTTWQLRFRIAQTVATADSNNVKAFKLKHQVNGTGGFTDVAAQGASGTKVRYANSANLADGDSIATGNFRLGAGTGTAVAGECNEAANTDSITFPIVGSASYTELVFALEWGDTISNLDTIEFRVYESNDTALSAYTVTPIVRHNSGSAAIEVVSSVIPGGGGDYTLLSTWEAGEQRDLIASDEIEAAECQSGEITNNVAVAGWITDAAHYPEIRAASGHEHGGLRTAGFRVTDAAGIIRVDQSDLKVRGIVILPTSNNRGINVDLGAATLRLTVDSNVIYGGGVSNGIGVFVGAATTAYVFNNFIYGFAGTVGAFGVQVNNASAVVNVYNNTIRNCRFCIVQSTGTLRLKNNIAQDATSGDYSGTFTNAEANISSDATSPNVALRSIDLDFADAANDDYHLAATDTEAIGAGVDLSADANLAFDYDIDGDERPSGDWDIGADQTAAAASPIGTAAAALRALAAAAVGAVIFEGSAAAQLTGLVAAATGRAEAQGSAAVAIQELTAVATGAQSFPAAAATALQDLTAAATGRAEAQGTAAASLQALTAVASGTFGDQTPSGSAAVTIQRLTTAASGALSFQGSAATALQVLAAAAVAESEVTGTADAGLQVLAAAATGNAAVGFEGSAAATLQALAAAAEGAFTPDVVSGSATATLRALMAAATGELSFVGSATAEVQALTSAATGEVVFVATAVPSLTALMADADGALVISGSAAAVLETLMAESAAAAELQGSATAVLERLRASAVGAFISSILPPDARIIVVADRDGVVVIPTRNRTIIVPARESRDA